MSTPTPNEPENKFLKFLKRWEVLTVLVLGITTGIVWPTVSHFSGRQNFGGEHCRTDEGCKSSRCNLKKNLCICTDGTEDYCKETSLVCGSDEIQCVDPPTAAPTCASSVFIREGNKKTAEDASLDANFGWSVSVDGNTAVIGSYKDESAYVFEGSGSEWTQSIKLTGGDTSSSFFGVSVAIDGETIIIGADGTAHVFQKSGSYQWDLLTKLEANDVTPGDEFGMNVALDGDTAIVGAIGDGTTRGNVYIFVRSGIDWVFQKKVSNIDGSIGDGFGQNIALHGDKIIVGYKSGAYIFSRTGSDWNDDTRLMPKDALCGSGCDVALNEDTAVIGAVGAAYIFTLTRVEWSQRDTIAGINVSKSPLSVAIDGNTLILGSGGNDPPTAYAYGRVEFDWVEVATLEAPKGASSEDLFGYSVAVSESESVVLIGAPGFPGKQGYFYPLDFSACV